MRSSEHESNIFYNAVGVKGLAALISTKKTSDDLKFIKRFSRKTDNILDLACGYGRLTIPLAQAGYKVVGIDLAQHFITDAKRRAKKQGLTIRFDVGSMTQLPYTNQSFDRIFCLWSSFNHLLAHDEQIRALNEMYRALRPSGLAFLDLINAESKKNVEKLKHGTGPDKRIVGEVYDGLQGYDYLHSRETLQKLCMESKFKNFRVRFMNLCKRRRIVAILYK